MNTEHLHNLFVINSVLFKDELKYYSNYVNTAILRRTSDELCKEYGINVKAKKKIRMCDEVVDNISKMKEQIRQADEKEQEKEQKKII